MTAKRKVVVITGAGSGVGRAVAIKLSGEGYACVLAGRRETELRTTADTCAGDTRVVPTDVSVEADVAGLFSEAFGAFGRVDVLFNNAGTFAVGTPIEDLTLDDWKRVVDVNLTGAFLCAREAVRVMKAQAPSGGRIINNGSISAHVPRPLSAPYTATKHAITGLTKSLALDGRAHNIACSQIDIGNAATDFTAKMARGILQANGTTLIEPRIDVTHVADAVAYIAGLPLEANVAFMTVMATGMPYIGRG